MDIKSVIDSNNCIIVLDTNVLLNIYRYSPEFSEFALDCIRTIKDYVVLPATVRLEYGKHCRAEFSKMQTRVKNAGNETIEQIKRAKTKVLATCDGLERLRFPDVADLRSSLSDKLDEVQTVLENFFEDRIGLDFVAHAWGNVDYVQAFVGEWDNAGSVMQSPTQEDIYSWCEDGENRYKKEIPPGFKDAKNKDGVRKFSDLILWKEVLRYAKNERKNIIFVTDDVKADWWEMNNGTKQFHQKLIEEFKKTGQQVYPFVSHEFYNAISMAYGVEQSDVVELALRMTDGDYCEAIADEVFDYISDSLAYSGTTLINEATAHIGSEGIEELGIGDYRFISAERIDRDDDVVTYQFKYQVTVEGTSFEYWGRDDDTKEVILSGGTEHVFEGIITVEVRRSADIYLDFEDDSTFDEAEIVDGDLEETLFSENWDTGEFEWGELGVCPDCGVPLDRENDAGGFCVNCMDNHD